MSTTPTLNAYFTLYANSYLVGPMGPDDGPRMVDAMPSENVYRFGIYPPPLKFDLSSLANSKPIPNDQTGQHDDMPAFAGGPALMYGLWSDIPGAPPAPDVSDGNLSTDYLEAKAEKFYGWLNSKGYRVGVCHVGNDATGLTITNVYGTSATGRLFPIGKPQIAQDDPDLIFGFAIGLVAMFVGAGWVMAVGNANISDSGWTGAALAVAGAAIGTDTSTVSTAASSTVSTGVSNMGDIYDGFNFSSGEGAVAYSDASVVDFGFGNIDSSGVGDPMDISGWGGGDVNGEATFGDGAYNYNSTPEVTTNDFGTTWDASFGQDAISTASTGIKIAQAGVAITRSQAGAPAGRKPPTQTPDIIGNFRNALRGLDSAASAVDITQRQMTTARPTSYSGQLTPSGGMTPLIGGLPVSTLMLAGGALLLVALVLHARG